MKYKKRPALIEATQWFRNGDHPQDQSVAIDSPDGENRMTEGKVVRSFKSLNIPGNRVCQDCGNVMKIHGEIIEGISDETEIVCPGDYIITAPNGQYYKIPPNIFEQLYEPYISGASHG